MDKKIKFIDEIVRLRTQQPIAGAEYYYISLFGSKDGKISYSIQSHWCGYTETNPRREIRKASIIDQEKMLSLLKDISEPGLLVNDKKDLFIFLLFGGHGVITKSLAEKYFKKLYVF